MCVLRVFERVFLLSKTERENERANEKERQRKTERTIARDRQIQRDRETERDEKQREREAERAAEREKQRERPRQTHRDRDRELIACCVSCPWYIKPLSGLPECATVSCFPRPLFLVQMSKRRGKGQCMVSGGAEFSCTRVKETGHHVLRVPQRGREDETATVLESSQP